MILRVVLSLFITSKLIELATSLRGHTNRYDELKLELPVTVVFTKPSLKLVWKNVPPVTVTLQLTGNCIYEGKFEDDETSKILLTGCHQSDFVLQVHGTQVKNFLFGSSNGEFIEIGTSDEINTRRKYPRSLPNDYDDYIDSDGDYVEFDFYSEFESTDNAEIVDFPLPSSPLVLNVNIYLDPHWVNQHESYAAGTALQVIQHASNLLQHKSLDIKITLRPTNPNNPYKTSEHAKPSRIGVTTFEKQLKDPFIVDGSPVTHILFTTSDEKFGSLGVGRLSSVCSSKVRPVALIKYTNNPLRLSITLAHEIGHVLGISHDFTDVPNKRKRCINDKKAGRLIMNYGEPRIEWSQCSNQDFRRLYNSVIYTKEKFCLQESNPKVTSAPATTTSTTPSTTVKSKGEWGEWGSWSPCTRACGVGRKNRDRYCKGSGCKRRVQSQTRFCNTQRC